MGATRQALSRKGMKKHLRVASNIWCVWLNMECVPFQKSKEEHILFCYNFVHESVLTNDYFNSRPYMA